jgi:hypothetical protein
VAYVRTVQTASGATAVQVVYSKRRGARRMEHIGSAHDEQEVEALKAAARQRLAGGQQQLDLGVDTDDAALAGPGPLPIVASRMGRLWAALCQAYGLLWFDQATGGMRCFGSWCWRGSSSPKEPAAMASPPSRSTSGPAPSATPAAASAPSRSSSVPITTCTPACRHPM